MVGLVHQTFLNTLALRGVPRDDLGPDHAAIFTKYAGTRFENHFPSVAAINPELTHPTLIFLAGIGELSRDVRVLWHHKVDDAERLCLLPAIAQDSLGSGIHVDQSAVGVEFEDQVMRVLEEVTISSPKLKGSGLRPRPPAIEARVLNDDGDLMEKHQRNEEGRANEDHAIQAPVRW